MKKVIAMNGRGEQMDDLIKRKDAIIAYCEHECGIKGMTRENCGATDCGTIFDDIPTADVRKNIKAKKIIGGGEHDGATCWFECSSCHGTVDINDAYCKHCGAVLEYET